MMIILLKQKNKKKRRNSLYLPKAEENYPLDTNELCKWIMWFKFFRENMIKDNQWIHCHIKWNVENDSKCPANPTGVQLEKLQYYHQDGAYRADNYKLPCPIFEQFQCSVVQMSSARLWANKHQYSVKRTCFAIVHNRLIMLHKTVKRHYNLVLLRTIPSR